MLLTTACVSTDVTPLSQDEFIITASAAPVCGMSGARGVASRMAAVQTLRSGYDHFIIVGAQAQSNVRAVALPPTSSYTTGQATAVGNTAYGSSTTTYSGGGIAYTGTNDAGLHVLMLRPGDKGYENSLDARAILGPDWERVVHDGIRTCN
jgi:hypothetical protein